MQGQKWQTAEARKLHKQEKKKFGHIGSNGIMCTKVPGIKSQKWQIE